MTEEQKQALIEWCNWRIAKGKSTLLADASYDAAVVALDALTVPPVKLPSKSDVKMGGDAKTRSLLTGMNMMRKSCADAIRAAGYQVEGE